MAELELFGQDLFGNPVAPPAHGAMAEKFLVPPFSTLNARDGYWQERKRAWNSLGIRGEQGRSAVPGGGDAPTKSSCYLARKEDGSMVAGGDALESGEDANATSVFDPVLCELAVRWFCPPGGHVLDPFAGEATKGIVTTVLGHKYTGIELRAEQIEANKAQAAAVGCEPVWIQGDSAEIGELLPPGERYDLVWTSPPYYDLEVYSKKEQDGSAFASYEQFMKWYELVFSRCVARLRPNRFLAVKVGEIRDKKGIYRNFVGDNITCFRRLGLLYYNEIILVTPVGSLPLRVGRQFQAGRKVGKAHQNILVFFKGDPRRIKEEFGELSSLP